MSSLNYKSIAYFVFNYIFRQCIMLNIFLLLLYQFVLYMNADLNRMDSRQINTLHILKQDNIDEEGISPLPKHILPELPILTNMICDEFYDIDSKKSKKEVDKGRSCLFTDYSLCYNLKKLKWIYYTNIDVFGYDINGKLSNLFLPVTLKNTINLRFASDTVKSFEKVRKKK
eukprot:551812_1